jgi:hypothetical protein
MRMKARFAVAICLLVSAAPLFCGCTMGPMVWTNEVTEELNVDTAGLAGLSVETHNGNLDYVAQAEHEPVAAVTIIKKGGGMTAEDAEAALKAIEVYIEPQGKDVKKIAWRWRTTKQLNWGACVGYRISAPAKLALTATSHNGHIEVAGIIGKSELESYNGHVKLVDARGDASLKSHNGRLEARSSGGSLHAESYNGEVTVAYEGGEINLESHNGQVNADLGKCGAIRGEIVSYNGGIEVVAGKTLAADLNCETYNGRIKCDVPWQVKELARGKAVGTIGQGGGPLEVTTHNGNIRIKQAGA